MHHRCQNGAIMETNSTSPVETPLAYCLLKITACCLLQLALNNVLNFHCVWDSFMSSQISVLRFSTFYPGHIYLIKTTSCCEAELRGTICLCAVKTLNTNCTILRTLTWGWLENWDFSFYSVIWEKNVGESFLNLLYLLYSTTSCQIICRDALSFCECALRERQT